ncbi:very short patch repair endonuclease [Agrococcus sediminis]|uniref:very short patch repair endonuclease n=1 Tax=Agrococcus sediminis TaxID=2599924 RepID=UPI003433AE12
MSELSDQVEAVLRAKRSKAGGWATNRAATAIMRANVRRDTQPEIRVRRLLHAAGFRYRVDVAPLREDRRRRADIVFTRVKVAVFIDGCFWHGCPDHFVPPQANSDYWAVKIARNQERDLETGERLTAGGWLALRFWEHEDPAAVAVAISEAVTRRRRADRGS